jgi:hypothetical protein
MRGITSGLQPRRYADGDLVQKALDLGVTPFGMSDEEIMQAISQKQQVDDISGASADFEEAGGEGYKMFGKDGLIFDYTNPVDYAMAIPVAGWAGAGIKALSTANKLRKLKKGADTVSKLNNPATRGIATGAFAADLGYDLATDPEMKDLFNDTAEDEAAKDLETVANDQKEKEEKEKEEKEDASLTKEQRMMKGIAALFEAYGESQSGGGTSLPGGPITTRAINTPEITRYQGGGIADMVPQEPMMMAGGGIAHFALGKEVIKKGAKKLSEGIKSLRKKRAKKKTDKAEAKAASQKPSSSTDLVPYERPDKYLPREFSYLASQAAKTGSKLKDVFSKKENIGRAAIYGGIPAAGVGINALFSDDEPEKIEKEITSESAAKVKLPDSLRDFHLENSMARAQAAGRDTPNFVDYAASFPKSYTDKLGSDPEFAKQMMAGFMAMMKPTEGFVPRNAFVDFGEAAMAEGARQEGQIPEALKTLQALQENPTLKAAYLESKRGEISPEDSLAAGAGLMSQVKEIAGSIAGRKIKPKENLVKEDGSIVTTTELIILYNTGGLPAVQQYAQTLTPEEG